MMLNDLIDKELISEILENKDWFRSFSPAVVRSFESIEGYTKEELSLCFYSFDSVRPIDACKSLIHGSYSCYPVLDDADYDELKDLIINEYLYSKISIDLFGKLFSDIDQIYLAALYRNIPTPTSVCLLVDECDDKQALLQNRAGFTFLSWSVSD